MDNLLVRQKDIDVELQTYGTISIDRVEEFNAKRKLLFNSTFIKFFQPTVQELYLSSTLTTRQDNASSIAMEDEQILFEFLYRPIRTVSSSVFYNTCDAISLIELTLLQLNDAIINAIKKKFTTLFFKVEARILHAMEDALINFSQVLSSYGVLLYIEISHFPFVAHNLQIKSWIRLREHNVKLVVDNYSWRDLDWRKLYIPADVFCCVKFDSPPLLDNEFNAFKDSLLLLQEKYSIKTIVGKVENKKQSEVALSCGCWAIQGFYYSKPRDVKLIDI